MNRVHTFDEVVGHSDLVIYLKSNLERGTLPHFLLFDGLEGLGKTTLADLTAIYLAYGPNPSSDIVHEVIDNHHSTDLVKRFIMSVDGGKEAAKQVLAEMTTSFNGNRTKVIICDECHGLSAQGQDVFLDASEFLDKNTYLIMLTTDPQSLKPTLRSRALNLHLPRLSLSDMVTLLAREARHAGVNAPMDVLQLIARWADGKPRAGLQLVNAFSAGQTLDIKTIHTLVGYLSAQEVLPILTAMNGNLLDGITYISDMRLTDGLVDVVCEMLRVKTGRPSYRFKMQEAVQIRDTLLNVDEEQIITFLYDITAEYPITRTTILHAFLDASHAYKNMKDLSTTDELAIEQKHKYDAFLDEQTTQALPTNGRNVAPPTLASLMGNSAIVLDDSTGGTDE